METNKVKTKKQIIKEVEEWYAGEDYKAGDKITCKYHSGYDFIDEAVDKEVEEQKLLKQKWKL